MPVGPEEDIVRAVCTDKWDGQRLSPSWIATRQASVSRLALTPLEDHWEMFRNHVQKPPERILVLIGEINLGRLQQIARAYEKAPVDLPVEPMPLDWNPAHAVIPESERITKGLASQIIKEVTLHHEPGAGSIGQPV